MTGERINGFEIILFLERETKPVMNSTTALPSGQWATVLWFVNCEQSVEFLFYVYGV